MAERRMFAKTIIDSDAFLEMPMSSQALYFHLNMRADDDGFINNPRKIQRMIGASDDDLKLLIAKRFVLAFENGVIVIKHWKIHNYIRKDRYHPTLYQDEIQQIAVKEDGSYTDNLNILPADGRPMVDQWLTEDRLGKVSIGKDIVNDDLSIINYLKAEEIDDLKFACGRNFDQLIKYADAKIKSRTDPTPISDPFLYLKQIAVNDGFIGG